MAQSGLPAEILLLFTVLIWALYFLIYLSSPENRVNQWACICGFLLSTGVFKEYLYFGGIFSGLCVEIFHENYVLEDLVNSILTAVLYYLAMPCVVIFSFYFCRLDKSHPRLFRLFCLLLFVPAFCFGMIYPWGQTREIPEKDPMAYTVVSVYNLLYGVIATVPIAVTLVKERKSIWFHQRRLVSLIALLPLWYWLLTLFLVHLLQLESLYKLWQGNALIILGLFLYYIRHLFKDGIWGMRLNRVYFDWSGEADPVPPNVRYVIHMLKNELVKLELCKDAFRRKAVPGMERELDIMEKSIGHIQEFIRKSSSYTQPIVLNPVEVNVEELLNEAVKEGTHSWDGTVEISVEPSGAVFCCDRDHMKEVLNNLVRNALDAMGNEGKLILSYRMPRRNIGLVRVEDTGRGIPESRISHIFDIYQSGYSDPGHMGLGLFYCQSVMRAHGGYIQVKSSTEKGRSGTVFTLCIPMGKRVPFGAMEKHEYGTGHQITDRGK